MKDRNGSGAKGLPHCADGAAATTGDNADGRTAVKSAKPFPVSKRQVWEAYKRVKANRGAAGIDGQTLAGFDWVVEVDIKGFFDDIDHDLLLKTVQHHTQARWVVMYIERRLKAPVQMPDGAMLARGRGTPQGGVISPLLSNLFLHYAFDMWMQRQFPGVPFERYADDVVCHCHSQLQADALISGLRQRLAQCGLQLHPQKTRIVYCKDADRRVDYPETSFDFLGYTFRPRLSMNRWGKTFVNFSPAMSARAGKAIRQEVRRIAVTSPCTSWRICSMRKSEAG